MYYFDVILIITVFLSLMVYKFFIPAICKIYIFVFVIRT